MPYGGRQEKSESFSITFVVTDFKSEMEKVHGANKGDWEDWIIQRRTFASCAFDRKNISNRKIRPEKKKNQTDIYIFSDFAAVLLQCTHTISLCLYISADSCFFLLFVKMMSHLWGYTPTEPGNIRYHAIGHLKKGRLSWHCSWIYTAYWILHDMLYSCSKGNNNSWALWLSENRLTIFGRHHSRNNQSWRTFSGQFPAEPN